jgi:hypothetical protein
MGFDPALVAVAVKVTNVPVHTGFAEATIEIPTGIMADTAMVIALEVWGLLTGHGSPDATSHLTMSLLAG